MRVGGDCLRVRDDELRVTLGGARDGCGRLNAAVWCTQGKGRWDQQTVRCAGRQSRSVRTRRWVCCARRPGTTTSQAGSIVHRRTVGSWVRHASSAAGALGRAPVQASSAFRMPGSPRGRVSSTMRLLISAARQVKCVARHDALDGRGGRLDDAAGRRCRRNGGHSARTNHRGRWRAALNKRNARSRTRTSCVQHGSGSRRPSGTLSSTCATARLNGRCGDVGCGPRPSPLENGGLR